MSRQTSQRGKGTATEPVHRLFASPTSRLAESRRLTAVWSGEDGQCLVVRPLLARLD